MKNLLKWFYEGYLLWAPILIICFPVLFIQNNRSIQKIFSSSYLILGSVCIFIVLLKNMKILFNRSVFELIKGYFSRFPLIKRIYVITPSSGIQIHHAGNVELFATNPWKTSDEGIKEIERRVDQLHLLMENRVKYLQDQIDTHNKQIKKISKSQQNEIGQISETISTVVIGDYKLIILSTVFTMMGIIFS